MKCYLFGYYKSSWLEMIPQFIKNLFEKIKNMKLWEYLFWTPKKVYVKIKIATMRAYCKIRGITFAYDEETGEYKVLTYKQKKKAAKKLAKMAAQAAILKENVETMKKDALESKVEVIDGKPQMVHKVSKLKEYIDIDSDNEKGEEKNQSLLEEKQLKDSTPLGDVIKLHEDDEHIVIEFSEIEKLVATDKRVISNPADLIDKDEDSESVFTLAAKKNAKANRAAKRTKEREEKEKEKEDYVKSTAKSGKPPSQKLKVMQLTSSTINPREKVDGKKDPEEKFSLRNKAFKSLQDFIYYIKWDDKAFSYRLNELLAAGHIKGDLLTNINKDVKGYANLFPNYMQDFYFSHIAPGEKPVITKMERFEHMKNTYIDRKKKELENRKSKVKFSTKLTPIAERRDPLSEDMSNKSQEQELFDSRVRKAPPPPITGVEREVFNALGEKIVLKPVSFADKVKGTKGDEKIEESYVDSVKDTVKAIIAGISSLKDSDSHVRRQIDEKKAEQAKNDSPIEIKNLVTETETVEQQFSEEDAKNLEEIEQEISNIENENPQADEMPEDDDKEEDYGDESSDEGSVTSDTTEKPQDSSVESPRSPEEERAYDDKKVLDEADEAAMSWTPKRDIGLAFKMEVPEEFTVDGKAKAYFNYLAPGITDVEISQLAFFYRMHVQYENDDDDAHFWERESVIIGILKNVEKYAKNPRLQQLSGIFEED